MIIRAWHLFFLTLAALSLSCKDALNEVTDALNADPQRSTCQAYCDWAATCNAQTPGREGEREALVASCLTATRAENGDCARMETEGINPASAELYSSCVGAIDARAAEEGSCAPFIGTAMEVNAALPPAACAAVATDDLNTFNAARVATAEPNEALCERVSATLCTRATACLVSEFSVPEEALAALMPAPLDRCVTTMGEGVTSSCVMEELYALDAPVEGTPAEGAPSVLFSANPSREAARACLSALASLSCADLFSGTLPPVCAGAFSDPVSAAGALRGFGCGLERPELEMVCGM